MATNVDELIQVYAADIVKMAEHDDGTVTVYGKAAGPDLDLDSQILDPTWLKEAMGDWFTKWGNIRESHDAHRAVGVATEYEPKDDDHFITAKIVDPLTVAKIRAGVLKGMSVGIKSPRVVKDKSASGGRIVGGKVVETSVVDNAANQSCRLVMKAVGADSPLVPVVDETPDVTKDASGHSHMHGHADGDHAHSHAHESSNYDHADGEPHAHDHDGDAPPLTDAPADQHRADAQASQDASAAAAGAAQAAADRKAGEAKDGGDDETPDKGSAAGAEGPDDDPEDKGGDPDPDDKDRGTPAAYEGDGDDDESDDKKKAKVKAVAPESVKEFIPDVVLAQLADEGKALSDHSYPIRHVGDLRDAVTLAKSGHGDVPAAKKLIKQRATELGREDLVPDAWKASDAFKRIMAADPPALMAELAARFGEKATDADLTMAGEPEAIASARRALASLVMDEAAEMFAGTEDETACMDALLDSLKALRLFEMMEHAEGETPASSEDPAAPAATEVEMATAADLVKVLTGDDTESATARDDIVKALGIDVDGLKAAVEEKYVSDIEATKADAEKSMKALEERLSQVEAMAAPGGPTRARRPADVAKTANADKLRMEAESYRNLADSALDQKLREGYRKLAAEASEKLASIEA